jgi:hypothetical protein
MFLWSSSLCMLYKLTIFRCAVNRSFMSGQCEGWWICVLMGRIRGGANLGVEGGMLHVSLWNTFAMSLVRVLDMLRKPFNSSCNLHVSFSSSFASLIWVSVTLRMALQNDVQSVCVVPVTFRNTFGMAFQTVLISRPWVSGITTARLSILFAQAMCANSSIPCILTLVLTSSSMIVVCSSSVSFSPTVFAVGVLSGHRP